MIKFFMVMSGSCIIQQQPKKERTAFDTFDFYLALLNNTGTRHDHKKFNHLVKEFESYVETINEKTYGITFYQSFIYATISFWIRELGELQKAKYYNELAEQKILHDNHSLVNAWILNNKGAFAINEGDFKLALDRFQEAYKNWCQTNNNQGMAFALNNIGVIKNSMGLFKDAREAFLESKEIHKYATGSDYRLITYSNLASTFKAEGKFDEALRIIEEGIQLEKKNKKATLDSLYLLSEKIDILIEMNLINNANKNLKMMRKTIEELQADSFTPMYYFYKGIIESKQMNFGLAKRHLYHTLSIASLSNDTYRLVLKAEMEYLRLLVQSFKIESTQEDLERAFTVVDNLLQATREHNFQPAKYDLMIIKANLLLMINRSEQATKLLNEVLEGTDKLELKTITKKAQSIMDNIISEKLARTPMQQSDELLDYITRSSSSILNFNLLSRQQILESKIYGVLVSTTEGIPIFSEFYDESINNDDVLISGLLSAVSTFTRDLSKRENLGILKSIQHENITILLERIATGMTIAFLADRDTHNLRIKLMQIANNVELSFNKNGIKIDPGYFEKNNQKIASIIDSALKEHLPEQVF
jgi:tetratricopeptide (TPR) repeat protein